jgi:hypothetical protein
MNTYQRVFNFLVTLALLPLYWQAYRPPEPERCNVGITFSNTPDGGEYVSFPIALTNLTQMTIISQVNFNGLNTLDSMVYKIGFSPRRGFDTYVIRDDGAGETWRVYFNHYFGDAEGQFGGWKTSTNDLVGTGLYTIAVTFDRTNVANNPIFYINGASVGITEYATPIGVAVNHDDVPLLLGYAGVFTNYNTLVYNRILSEAEILDLYNSRGADHNDYGLVFHAPCIGATGIQTFDGATLGATNYVYDRISGLKGTPSGSPVGVADTVLTYIDQQ